ncbi:prenyltransferase/squalene oxidase repeat-containing protein [Streptomyces sp. NBC_00047]|uniref:terpene cyclase/mutase family protein n=1 Tax=Streptomyces sp. NBC_00047 TaxID=2975627 RepID=UPI002B1D109D|nr:prenyltransferase/squalene oxidase repeat-containing protein [Streptomyces sp. NBC_00047]
MTTRQLAERARTRAVGHLLSRQDAQGWWKGTFECNVTGDAEDLLLRQFLGIGDEKITHAASLYIRGEQREDGTWSTFYGGPGDLSTSIEAYVALRLAGDAPDEPHMAKAAAWIRAHGGIAASRVFTRIWLALFGWWKWEDLPALPPELMFLPKWFPLNIHHFASWSRQTIVSLSVVCAERPVRPAPFTLGELYPESQTSAPSAPRVPASHWTRFFTCLDKALHAYHKVAPGRLRRAAMSSVARWIMERQESDGCWGGLQVDATYALIALHLLGYRLEHPVMHAGLASLDAFAVWRQDGARMIEVSQSPVWDTSLAVNALADAGVRCDHPALISAADWMLGKQHARPGDWAVRRPRLDPGGWAFQFHNESNPDLDDTAEVILALRRLRHPDPPSADVTAHVVEMLACEGKRDDPRTRRGIAFLLAEQEASGAWFGRWGVNYLYGTGAVVPALTAAGLPAAHPAIRRAVTWLCSVQNEDGGWGEDVRSYRDERWAGQGTSTPSQTAWALLAVLAAGEGDSEAVERGVRWLVQAQHEDGTWEEPHFTGTGFPGDCSIRYHLYRQVFPLMALGRYLHQGRPGELPCKTTDVPHSPEP